MNLSYEKQMTIAITTALIQKYGAVLSDKDFANFLGLSLSGLRNKVINNDDDLPKHTQLRNKRVFMASDIAEWMVNNDLKFPK